MGTHLTAACVSSAATASIAASNHLSDVPSQVLWRPRRSDAGPPPSRPFQIPASGKGAGGGGEREGVEEEQEEEEEEEHCDDGKGGGGRAVVRLPRGPLPPRKQQVLAMLHHLRTAA